MFRVQTEGIRSYHDMNVPYTVLTIFGSGRKEYKSLQGEISGHLAAGQDPGKVRRQEV